MLLAVPEYVMSCCCHCLASCITARRCFPCPLPSPSPVLPCCCRCCRCKRDAISAGEDPLLCCRQSIASPLPSRPARTAWLAAAAPWLYSHKPTCTPPPGPRLQMLPVQNNRHAISVGEDGLARVWDAVTGTVVHALSGHDSATISYLGTSRDGTLAATGMFDARSRV